MPKSQQNHNGGHPMFESKALMMTSNGLQIRLYVKPNSKVDRIIDVQGDCVHIAVQEPARGGEANCGVIDLMAGVLGFRKGDSVIIAGHKSRQKVMLVHSSAFSNSEEDQKKVARLLERLQQTVGH